MKLDPRGKSLPEAAVSLARKPECWPARLVEMTDVLLDEVDRSGLLGLFQDKRGLAIRLVTRLCQEYGGTREYWPKPERITRALRDAAIWAQYDGTEDGPNGVRALARRHRITEHEAREIIRREQARHREPNGCDPETR